MSNVAHRLRGWLVDYKWRFAPLVHVNLARRDRNTIPLTIDITEEEVDLQLQSVLKILSSEFAPLDFRKRIPAEQRARATELLTEHLSFTLVKKSSSIKGCGQGIFVEKGVVPARRVVALYPGTIYDPWDSILLQSIGNHFVLRCQDGVTIDGNDVRLSRWIHRSCAYRDLSPAINDLTWLEDTPFNYLNMGHYVNNEPAPNAHNVHIAHRLRDWLVDYKWRFAPLVHVNLARRDRNTIPLTIDITEEEVGRVPARRVVALYPGTIYNPWDSILLQSIGNHFVLRCQDGVTIDGNNVSAFHVGYTAHAPIAIYLQQSAISLG